MELNVNDFWLKMGAVAVKVLCSEAVLNNNILSINLEKKEIIERAKTSILNDNGTNYRYQFIPFLFQYNPPKKPFEIPVKLNKFLKETTKGKKKCVVCNRKVDNVGYESIVSTPFAVKAENFQNFYSFGKNVATICSDCQFLGLLAPLAAFFNVIIEGKDKIINYIFLEDSNIEQSYKSYLWFSEIKEESPMSNFKISSKFYPRHPHETLLLTLYEVFKRTRILRNTTYRVITIKISGKTSTILTYFTFEITEKFRRFFKSLEEDGVNLNQIIDAFVVKEEKIITDYRNKLSEKILKGLPIEDFVEEFIFKYKTYIPDFHFLVIQTNKLKGVKALDEKFIEMCKKNGENIGNAIFEADSFGDLYSLRNSKTLENFLESLSQLTVRYAKENRNIRITEDFIGMLNDEDWKKAKSLLVIFAVNKYLQRNFARKGGEISNGN